MHNLSTDLLISQVNTNVSGIIVWFTRNKTSLKPLPKLPIATDTPKIIFKDIFSIPEGISCLESLLLANENEHQSLLW